MKIIVDNVSHRRAMRTPVPRGIFAGTPPRGESALARLAGRIDPWSRPWVAPREVV
jgi:hypothetical protein